MTIDIAFDFRTDTPEGEDPDACSPTLRRYHRLLWSKRLPSGSLFDLSDTTRGVYLHHRSALGEFFLSSGREVGGTAACTQTPRSDPATGRELRNTAAIDA